MDDVTYLIDEQEDGRDADGNVITVKTPRMVYCKVDSVSRNESYAAGTDDIKPELDLVISNRIDYHGENLLRFHSELFDVIRTYWRGDSVTLTVAKHIGINDEASA